jgi:hypothetical protein
MQRPLNPNLKITRSQAELATTRRKVCLPGSSLYHYCFLVIHVNGSVSPSARLDGNGNRHVVPAGNQWPNAAAAPSEGT